MTDTPDDPTGNGTHVSTAVLASVRGSELFRDLPKRMIAHLLELEHLERLQGPFGRVSRVTHSLQSATLAQQAGEDEAYVVAALFHDIGDLLGPYNHGQFAATLLAPFVTEANHWMLAHHHAFQGYYYFEKLGLDPNMRDRWRGHPNFEYTLKFCERYDMPAFDPDLPTQPLEAFLPAVHRVLYNPKHTVYVTTAAGP